MANHNSTPRLGLYARVSTKNNGQDPETQLIALREYAKARGFEIYQEYVGVGISGAKEKRPALNELMMDSNGVPIGSIQRILGHEHRTTTEIYLHSLGESEREAMVVFENASRNSHTDVVGKETWSG